MERTDLRKIAGSLRQIQRIPLLGRFLRAAHLGHQAAVFALAGGTVAVLAIPYALSAANAWTKAATAGETPGPFLVAAVIATPLTYIAAALLLYTAWKVRSLPRQVLQHLLGNYHEWLGCFFGFLTLRLMSLATALRCSPA